MKTTDKILSCLMLALTLGSGSQAFAQIRTESIDLSRRDSVPLYDCSIMGGRENKNLCDSLVRGDYYPFEARGYAVNCNDLGRGRRDNCYYLASNLLYGHSAIRCDHLRYQPRELEQCQITKRAYEQTGRFDYRFVNPPRPVTTTTTHSTVNRDVYTQSTTTCQATNYDEAYRRWDDQRRYAQAESGKNQAIVGGATMIIGTILRGSGNSNIARAAGTGLQIGGAVLLAHGLVQIVDADQSLPHMVCTQNYITETRMVTVERQQCETTRYTDRFSNRHYYEVRCETQRYVTFEEFDPWRNGRTVTTTTTRRY